MIHAQKAASTTDPASPQLSVSRMADLLGVSRSGYYAWAKRQASAPGPRMARREALAAKIVASHEASDRVYGSPRITADLREAGEIVTAKTVAAIMRDKGLQGVSPRRFTPCTTISDATPHRIPDLVKRCFDTGQLNQVWTSDITYLDTDEGWLYLCAVRDGCSRRVLGYAFADTLHTTMVETALRRAVTFRDGDTNGVILHADRGVQYTSAQLSTCAEELGVRLSMGRTGVCFDNAQQESFWSSLKTEFYDRHHFTTRADATRAVTEWIETVYNRNRRHSALGQIDPVTYEHTITTAVLAA